MNDKMFELMEKMYIEVSSFRTDITTEVKGIRQDLNGVREDVKALKQDVRKNTMQLESMNSKLETMAEVQKSHMDQNEKAHNDIISNLGDKIDVVELSVKYTSKDVIEIKNGLTNVEIITSSNWNEIAKLKAVR